MQENRLYLFFQTDNIDDNDDVLTSMMMSTTPSSYDPNNQIASLSTSFKNSRNPLPFGRSPGFRNTS